MKKICFIILFLLNLLLNCVNRPNNLLNDESTPVSALFLGNSYTHGNSMPNLIQEFAKADGNILNASWNQTTPGGYRLSQHRINTGTLNAINEQQWDYIVLQDQSGVPAASCGDYTSLDALALWEEIQKSNPTTKILLFSTWGYLGTFISRHSSYDSSCSGILGYDSSLPELSERQLKAFHYMTQATEDAYRETKTYIQTSYPEASITLIPTGCSWRTTKMDNQNYSLHLSDGSHANINGSYIAAANFYEIMFQKDVNTNPYSGNVDNAIYLKQMASRGAQNYIEDSGCSLPLDPI